MYWESARRTENAKEGHVQYAVVPFKVIVSLGKTEYVAVVPSTWYWAWPH